MAIAINGNGTVTGVSVGGLPDGIVDNDMIANTTIAEAKLAASVHTITELDQWWMTTDKTSDGTITDLARVGYTGAASHIGTGMSQSSGIFTFPSTGLWLVSACATFNIDGSDNCNVSTQITINNSSYAEQIYAQDANNGTGSKIGQGFSTAYLDVTSTTNVKVKFVAGSLGGSSNVAGCADNTCRTWFMFKRIGDT
tara:strand:+ start:515 stop:1105 length:591 start_codon:yes stop_codon:yes gene_type:complete